MEKMKRVPKINDNVNKLFELRLKMNAWSAAIKHIWFK